MKSTIIRTLLVGCILIIEVCLNLTGCDKDEVIHELVGWVEGTAIDSITRQPVEGAVIRDTADTTVTPRARTDSLGYYKLAATPGTRFCLYCSKEGFITKKSLRLEVRKHETMTVDFELVPLRKE